MWITTWQDQLEVAPRGHCGDPRAASAEKGEGPWEAIGANGVEVIEALRKFRGSRRD